MTSLYEMIPKSEVPAGTSGAWAVEKFEVSEEDARMFNLGQWMSGSGGRRIKPGRYTRLVRGKASTTRKVVMSDTPAEIRESYEMVRAAHGSVLITGLGLGVSTVALSLKTSITAVKILEISTDVISLVAPTVAAAFEAAGIPLEIVHQDALTYRPENGESYQTVWHDIWTDISLDNRPQYTTLKRRWASRSDWQGAWADEYLTELRRSEYEGRRVNI